MDTLFDPAEWFAWSARLWRGMYAPIAQFPSLAPQALTQPILPGWIFANDINVTEQNSSAPGIEREILAVHSYGRQLGRIIDVLAVLIEKWPGGAPDDPSVQHFTELRDDITAVKTKRIIRAISDLAEMKEHNPDEYDHLIQELREILKAEPDQ